MWLREAYYRAAAGSGNAGAWRREGAELWWNGAGRGGERCGGAGRAVEQQPGRVFAARCQAD